MSTDTATVYRELMSEMLEASKSDEDLVTKASAAIKIRDAADRLAERYIKEAADKGLLGKVWQTLSGTGKAVWSFIKEHPWLSAALVTGGILSLPQVRQFIGSLFEEEEGKEAEITGGAMPMPMPAPGLPTPMGGAIAMAPPGAAALPAPITAGAPKAKGLVTRAIDWLKGKVASASEPVGEGIVSGAQKALSAALRQDQDGYVYDDEGDQLTMSGCPLMVYDDEEGVPCMGVMDAETGIVYDVFEDEGDLKHVLVLDDDWAYSEPSGKAYDVTPVLFDMFDVNVFDETEEAQTY